MLQERLDNFNRNCAEFLEFKFHKESEYWTTMLWGGAGFTLRQMKFHSDWNWLMLVCRKLDDLYELKLVKHSITYERLCDELDDAVTRYDINEVVMVADKFLIWYKTQFKTKKKAQYD